MFYSEKSYNSQTIKDIQDIPFRDIDDQGIISHGHFGVVYKGIYNRFTSVALKSNHSNRESIDKEAFILWQLTHPNVVEMHGLTTKKQILHIVMEYSAFGSLDKFLSENKEKIKNIDLFHISHQIAAGMEYLKSERILHRDLAARNCLVLDNLTVKVADFGLSSDIVDDEYYEVKDSTPIPIRWMPPEVLFEQKHTFQSDVWSYGILLYEIFTRGKVPWEKHTNTQVKDIVRKNYHFLDKDKEVKDIDRKNYHEDEDMTRNGKLSYEHTTVAPKLYEDDSFDVNVKGIICRCLQLSQTYRPEMNKLHHELKNMCEYKIPACSDRRSVTCVIL